MTKFRPHRGSLADSMAEVIEVADFDGLCEHLEKMFGGFPGIVKVEPYAIGGDDRPFFDDRLGWHTYIVTSERGVLGFTDGPLSPVYGPGTPDWVDLAAAAVRWRAAREECLAEPVADVRKSHAFGDALNALAEAEDKLAAAALLFTPTCPFCGKLHAGSLPCRHCGEPDMPTPDEEILF